MGGDRDPRARRTDSQQLARQWALLRLLSESGRAWAVKDLAEQLGCSKPTIERDLDTLEHEFALVEEQAGKQKKLWRIDRRVEGIAGMQFGTMELLALHAGAASLRALADTFLYTDIEKLLLKVRGALAPKHNGGLDAMGRVFQPHARGHVDYGDGGLIDDLVDAISRPRWCRVTYWAAWRDRVAEHRLRPLRLVWHRSSLYLLCALDGRDDITTLAVHRIRELEITPDEFRPPRLDLDDHVRRAFGIFVSAAEEEVEILFDAEIAWRVEERVYHPDERKERLEDGRLRYRVRTSAQWEIIPWVQQFGPLAELVAPTHWRQALVENLDAARARYR
jgi:predicted DNA-binding transcriptional regulator YafY